MYRSFIITIIFLQEENRRLEEQEKAVEANNLAEAKLALVKEELRKELEEKMQLVAVNPYFLIAFLFDQVCLVLSI